MVLAREQTYRSMGQNKGSGNRPTHIQLIDFLKKALNQFNGGKERFFFFCLFVLQMVLEQLNIHMGKKLILTPTSLHTQEVIT